MSSGLGMWWLGRRAQAQRSKNAGELAAAVHDEQGIALERLARLEPVLELLSQDPQVPPTTSVHDLSKLGDVVSRPEVVIA